MRKFAAVFLDLDHTLVDTRRQYDVGLTHTLQVLYDNQVPETWVERFLANHQALWAQYDKREITMADLRRERFLRAWSDHGVHKTLADAAEFQSVYDANFDNTLFPYEETLDLVSDLARDHRLGIVTNGSPDLQQRKLSAVGLASYFPEDTIIISERIGMAKPHPSVYQAACDALRIDASEAVMIGDNYHADVEGAMAFGMSAIWYVPDPVMAHDAEEQLGKTPLTTREQVLSALKQLESSRN